MKGIPHSGRVSLLVLYVALFTKLHAQTGFVHLSKGKLVDGNNAAVKLNGVNLGGWLLWEGWIWGGKFKSESSIKARMTEMFGKDQADKYISAYYNSFITAEDIRAIARLGMNAVRLPVNHSLFERDEDPGLIRPEGFRYIDSVIAWAKHYKVYVIIDLHAAPGGQSPYFISDPDKKNLWKDPQNRARTLQVWKALAERYKNEEWVGAYDLLNEPIPGKDENLLLMYKDLIETIRSVDKDHLLIIEGKAFATRFDFFTGTLDPNQVFSFHFYTWFVADPVKKLNQYSSFAKNLNVPMWCGEWGEDKPQKINRNLQLLNDSAFDFCGSAFWTWKRVEKDPNRPALNRIALNAESTEVIKWLNGNGKKPDPETARQGMEDFIRALLLEKTVENAELKTILKIQ
ncbi:MAG: glycoside hydrolase family 5 protein [Bacteroidia bacterium]